MSHMAFCNGKNIDSGQFKYSISLGVGAMGTVAEKGPKTKTSIGDMRFLHPWDVSFNGVFNISLKHGFSAGLELGIDRFDYGYKAEQLYAIDGISSGLLASDANINLYRAGVRCSYDIRISKRILIQASLAPSIGFYPHIDHLDDTAALNEYQYRVRPAGTGKTQYIELPPYQNSKPKFLVRSAITGSYKIGKRMHITGDISYQQGFKSFLIHYVMIRQIDPVTFATDQQQFYTKINGSCFQFHIGFRYEFGSHLK